MPKTPRMPKGAKPAMRKMPAFMQKKMQAKTAKPK